VHGPAEGRTVALLWELELFALFASPLFVIVFSGCDSPSTDASTGAM